MAPKRGYSSDSDSARSSKKPRLVSSSVRDDKSDETLSDAYGPDTSESEGEDSTEETEEDSAAKQPPKVNPMLPADLREGALNTFDIRDLSQHGYIDCLPKPTPGVSFAFTGVSMPVHGIFQRANWCSMTNLEWTQLQPTLHLATRFLNEPHLNHFFQSLVFGSFEKINNPALEKKLGYPPMKFGRLSIQERKNSRLWYSLSATRTQLLVMRDLVSLEWADAKDVDPGELAATAATAQRGLKGP